MNNNTVNNANTTINNFLNNGNNNNNNPLNPQQQVPQADRKPLNTGEDANIYDTSVKNISKENNFRGPPVPENTNRSPTRNPQYNMQRGADGSPTHSLTNGATRIAKRELWWKEPPASEVKIAPGSKFKPDNVTPRVDHQNPNYKPARESSKVIETRKLAWNKRSMTDTWGNFSHKPKGYFFFCSV